MIRQFLTFREAAAELATDYEGLRQGFETGLAQELPAYVYGVPFLGTLTGCKVEENDGFPKLHMVDGRAVQCGWPFDADEACVLPEDLGDGFGDIAECTFAESVTGKPVAFDLRGYFRVAASEMKQAAREHHLGMPRVAPASWWTDASPVPRSDDGHPRHFFRLMPIDCNPYKDPPELSDVWFRVDDVRALKAARMNPTPAIAPDKPLDERTRTTLLCIIGALAIDAELDLSQPYKAGEQVAAMLPGDVKLTARTIGDHLKAVQPAMDSRKG